MKKLVCIFAHPDDETFMVGGTIAKLSKDYEIYVLCATKGEAGKNSLEETKKLGQIRAKELENAAKILGIKKVYFLGFLDGTLSNNLYHKLATKIQNKLEELRPDVIMSNDPTGISGHIDHITIAMVTLFVFHKLSFIKTLWQYCGKAEVGELMKETYFIHFPKGYTRDQVDKVIDVSDVWETKVAAMKQHKSQMHDVERILHTQKNLSKEEYFFVINK
jgi:LmbE family N-acetylglucosaminyl deacetylase